MEGIVMVKALTAALFMSCIITYGAKSQAAALPPLAKNQVDLVLFSTAIDPKHHTTVWIWGIPNEEFSYIDSDNNTVTELFRTLVMISETTVTYASGSKYLRRWIISYDEANITYDKSQDSPNSFWLMLQLFDNKSGLVQRIDHVNEHFRQCSGGPQGDAGNLDLKYELNNISTIRLTATTSGGTQIPC
jgi:hypothetical protein